jgi:hypothetical protein
MVRILKNPRVFCSMIKGQNYWFNGCMEFLMECLGENHEYDYWFFSGITGDSFLQIYSRNISNMVLCYTDKFLSNVIKYALDVCGYDFEHFFDLGGKKHDLFDDKIKEHINKNIPVIAKINIDMPGYGVIYAYDNDKYYCVYGEKIETIITSDQYSQLVFVKQNKPKPDLAEVYKRAVMNIPSWIKMPAANECSFGKQAFLDWADSFQNGTFDTIPPDDKIWHTHPVKDFSCWNMHGTYLCMLGTNNCSIGFMEKALYYNPKMDFIKELIPLYEKINTDGFHKLIAMLGGFGIKPETIKNKAAMKPITAEITKLGLYHDAIVKVFEDANRGKP